jgi:hypothetical protein
VLVSSHTSNSCQHGLWMFIKMIWWDSKVYIKNRNFYIQGKISCMMSISKLMLLLELRWCCLVTRACISSPSLKGYSSRNQALIANLADYILQVQSANEIILNISHLWPPRCWVIFSQKSLKSSCRVVDSLIIPGVSAQGYREREPLVRSQS